MSQVSSLQSLDLILEDVSAEINLAINSLDNYSKSYKNLKSLKKSIAHLQKLKGVFTLLEMQGAQRLVGDAIGLLKSITKRKPTSRAALLETTSTSLARLMRYSEHINHKPCDIPQLLLPSINDLRQCANVPVLGESVFFIPDGTQPRNEQGLVLVTSEESATASRHYRQMYQIGLIEVLRKTNLTGGLRMMQKALVKLDKECPRPHSPNLWWIAEAMIQCFIDEKLAMTRARLKLFSRIDRQIRKVENKRENLLDDNKLEMRLLTKEMLYLTSISGSKSSLVTSVLNHFEIVGTEITDAVLREEMEELRGPSDQDYKSIAEALLTEVDNIESILRNCQEHALDAEEMDAANKQMNNLNNLLKILQIDDQSVRLSVAIDLMEKAQSEAKLLSAKDFNILYIVLDSIRKALDDIEVEKLSGKTSNRRKKLNKAEQQFWEQTNQSIKALMQCFTRFTKENKKALILKEAPGLLDDIATGFAKLKVSGVENIISGCSVFIQHHLIKNPHSTSDDALNLFADTLGSLEFYLETLKFTATPSSRILQFADNSLLQLNRTYQK
ncbi:MAG: hypothetical protein OQK51_03015 [Kangiellaceae bacterium]|nr:hypothetical protein [Kangiellaceae bacterium]